MLIYFFPGGSGYLHNKHFSGLLLRFVSTILLLLGRFSRVRLCATPQTAAHQAPLSLGFFRQEYWRGLPFPSPVKFYMPFILRLVISFISLSLFFSLVSALIHVFFVSWLTAPHIQGGFFTLAGEDSQPHMNVGHYSMH